MLRELWEEFEVEVPFPFVEERETLGRGVARHARRHPRRRRVPRRGRRRTGRRRPASRRPVKGRAHIQLVHVRPRARRQGVATALLRACVQDARDRGARAVSLDVLADNAAAREVWRRLGFEELDADRWSRPSRRSTRGSRRSAVGESRARPTSRRDDGLSVERAIAHFVPRLEAPEVSANGSWIRIVDPALDARPRRARRGSPTSSPSGSARSRVALALEHGAVVRFRLYERGRMVDEYLSVPTYYGALPKVDELALAANPTLVARLDRRRRATRCGASRARRQRRGRPARRRRSSTSRSRR